MKSKTKPSRNYSTNEVSIWSIGRAQITPTALPALSSNLSGTANSEDYWTQSVSNSTCKAMMRYQTMWEVSCDIRLITTCAIGSIRPKRVARSSIRCISRAATAIQRLYLCLLNMVQIRSLNPRVASTWCMWLHKETKHTACASSSRSESTLILLISRAVLHCTGRATRCQIQQFIISIPGAAMSIFKTTREILRFTLQYSILKISSSLLNLEQSKKFWLKEVIERPVTHRDEGLSI